MPKSRQNDYKWLIDILRTIFYDCIVTQGIHGMGESLGITVHNKAKQLMYGFMIEQRSLVTIHRYPLDEPYWDDDEEKYVGFGTDRRYEFWSLRKEAPEDQRQALRTMVDSLLKLGF